MAVLGLPFVRFRPNRILSGEPYRLWEIADGCGFLISSFLMLAAVLYVLLPAKRVLWRATVALAAGAGTLLTMAFCTAFSALQGEAARVSIGAGFFAAVAGVLLMLGDLGLQRGTKLPGFILLALLTALVFMGRLDGLSVMREYATRREAFLAAVGRHLTLAASATAVASGMGILMAFLLFSRPRLERPFFFAVNIGQTMPTLSMLGFLMVPLAYLGTVSPALKRLGVSGVGFWPAFMALVIYALFPVLHNTLAGLQMVDPAAVAAATSVGMGRKQVFFRVQLPLAVPLILGGIRTALTQSMGNATLAALIGGGGLGNFIFLGLAQSAPDLILLGAAPLIALTFVLDALLARAVRALRVGGMP